MARFFPLLALAACCGLLLCACARTLSETTPPPAKEPVVMATTEDNAPTPNSTLSAEEIGTRFLTLIEGLKSRDDLSIERVQEVMEVTLLPNSNGKSFDSSKQLGSGWFYILNYVVPSKSLKKGVGLSFGKPGENWPDMTPVCALNFDRYHDALKAMGFRDVPIVGEIGELRSWRYYKDGDITISIIPQNVIPGEAGRLCVSSIGTLN